MKIYAPRSGMISKVYSEQGSFARAGLVLANLADTTQLTAFISVDSASLPYWVPGAAVSVTVAGVATAPAQVTAVKGGAGLPAGIMLAELTIDNSQSEFRLGAVGLAEITGPVSSGVLAVPETSVVTREQQKFIRVLLPDGRLHRQVMTILAVNEAAEQETSQQRLAARANHDARLVQRSFVQLTDLGRLAYDNNDCNDNIDSILLTACRKVAAAQGIDPHGLIEPPGRQAMGIATAVRNIADAGHFRVRQVLLRGRWYEEDNGPLLGCCLTL